MEPLLLVDSAGVVVPVRNLQFPAMELDNCGPSLGPADTLCLCPPIARDPNAKGMCRVALYVVRELKMGKFSFHNCRFIHFRERLSSNVTFESFYYKQYEWIVMLSVLIVLS
jgi:hypothetical protein